MRAHWMLLELGLEYEFHPIQPRTGETLRDDFLRINPRHKIPVLRHGPRVLTESAAIIQYLAEVFANPEKLYVPEDAGGRAELNEWCYFILSELDAASLYVMRRHDGLKQLYGEAPVAVEAAKRYFLHNLETMASRVAGGDPYLLGKRFSAADVLLVTCLDWARASGIALPGTCADYRERVTQRPAYRAALQRNFAR